MNYIYDDGSLFHAADSVSIINRWKGDAKMRGYPECISFCTYRIFALYIRINQRVIYSNIIGSIHSYNGDGTTLEFPRFKV